MPDPTPWHWFALTLKVGAFLVGLAALTWGAWDILVASMP
jgi:hypothetical protein